MTLRDRRWLAMAALAFPTLMIGLDLTVLHLAVPSIVADLDPSRTAQLWIVDVYGFAVAGLLITMGNIGDRIGRRRLLMIGATGFAVASVVAAFAPTAGALVAARALLGVAGATLMPSTLSLIRDLFPDDRERTVAISVWMGSLLTGTALGPLVGGVLLELFWWGAVFLLAVPVMVALLVVGPILLPAGRGRPGAPMDWTSVVLSLLAVLPFVYAVKHAAAHGPQAWLLLLLATSVLSAVTFVRRQRGLAEPLIDVSLFARPAFTAATLAHLGGLFALGGVQYLFALYLQLVVGLEPLAAGLWTLPGAGLGLVGALLAPALAARLGRRTTASTALAIGAVGLLGFLAASMSGPGVAVASFAVASLAIGLVTTLATDGIVSAAPPERAGMASGISETAAELGIALGVALLGSVATAVQSARVPGALTEGADAQVRAAFTDGLGVAAVVGAVLLAALAVLTARHLPSRAPDHAAH